MERYLVELDELKKTRQQEKDAFFNKIATDNANYEKKQREMRATNRDVQNFLKHQIEECDKARHT